MNFTTKKTNLGLKIGLTTNLNDFFDARIIIPGMHATKVLPDDLSCYKI